MFNLRHRLRTGKGAATAAAAAAAGSAAAAASSAGAGAGTFSSIICCLSLLSTACTNDVCHDSLREAAGQVLTAQKQVHSQPEKIANSNALVTT